MKATLAALYQAAARSVELGLTVARGNTMEFMLLAEDLLLLLTDDETGKLAASGTEVDVALGGALLVELALTGRVDIAGRDERVREGRLVVRDASPTGDGLLDEALALVVQKEGRRPQSLVTRLGKRARVRLLDRLVEGGVLRAEDDRILGIFPTHRWPSNDAAHESSVRAALLTALREGATAEPRTGALISLLLALNAVHMTVDPGSVGLSKRELKRTPSGSPRATGRPRPSDRQSTA